MDTVNLLMPLMIVTVFYFFFLRPQQKARKDQDAFLEGLSKGDEIVTTSGILGQINKIDENVITLQVDTKTFIRVTKSALSKELTDAVNNPPAAKKA